MISQKYKLTNKNGESITINDHATTPNQVIALQSYPIFNAAIKNNEINKSGQHGIWDFFSYYGRRISSFSGLILGETEQDVEIVKNQLLTVLALPSQPTDERDGFVLLEWTDVNGDDWQLEGKITSPVQFSRNLKETFRLDFNFSIKSPDPFIVSQALSVENGVRGYIQAGAKFPLELPALLGGTVIDDFSIDNTGNAFAQTIIRIHGESQGVITNPKVQNLTTGLFIKVNTTIADETKYIEIDSKEGTVVDQDGIDRSGLLDTASQFIQLGQGLNDILYTSDEDPQQVLYLPTAVITVSYRDTKI